MSFLQYLKEKQLHLSEENGDLQDYNEGDDSEIVTESLTKPDFLTDDQDDTIEFRCKDLGNVFRKEVYRLINSGGVNKDKYGNYPLPSIFKVALENMADKEGINDKSAYRNLKKF